MAMNPPFMIIRECGIPSVRFLEMRIISSQSVHYNIQQDGEKKSHHDDERTDPGIRIFRMLKP